MPCRVVDQRGVREIPLDPASLEGALANGFSWIDLHRPKPAEVEVLRDAFGFHPLAIEDSLHFGQRPKFEDYDSFVFIVLYGHAPDRDGLVEVHVYYSERFLVTIRRDASPGLDALHALYREGRRTPADPIVMLHRIADALTDSFFPALNQFDDRLDLIEDDALAAPKDEHLRDVFTMRRRLARLRRVLGPQRDLFARLAAGTVSLPGMTPEHERYFRDVHDHLLRLAELTEASRDLMTSATDVYLSASSNRLNIAVKQLTAVATIFLPLTFITGFFGQNFGWMVEHVDSAVAFFALGIALQAAAVVGLLAFFRARGWF
jgi:magnesium transporter